MVFSWIESKKELDVGLCVLDVRYSQKREAWIYSGLDSIINQLIKRNKILDVKKHSIELDFISKRKFTFRGRTFDGLWQNCKNKTDTYMFISHSKMYNEGNKFPFPGLIVSYKMLEDDICEIRFTVENLILSNFVRSL